MRWRAIRTAWVWVIVLACFAKPAVAEENQPDASQGWEAVAAARGIAGEDLERLRSGKILITGETFRQVFTPYLDAELPLFITSDSLLNAFHVLYEESLFRLESGNAEKLAEILKFVAAGLDRCALGVTGDSRLVEMATRRARLVLGTALELLGAGVPGSPEAPTIEAERARVEAAAGVAKPAWLGLPTADLLEIDYARFRPRGFYTGVAPRRVLPPVPGDPRAWR